jgi:hypothetical protein
MPPVALGGFAMDALISSAQSWAPWAGVAGLVLCKGWIASLGLSGRDVPAPLGGYFLCLGLGAVVPALAGLLAWTLRGGLAMLGPVALLAEPASANEQAIVALFMLAPAAAFLLARFIFGRDDAFAYALATAAGIAGFGLLNVPAALALALGVGGLAAFVARGLGDVAAGLAAALAFILGFALSATGGANDAVALLTLVIVGGLVLALVSSAGTLARVPLFALMPLVPAFALAAADGNASGLDLSRALSVPAIGTIGALVLLFGVVPALIAPFAWLPMLAARASSRISGAARWVAEPAAIVIELALGLALAALGALALTAGGAVFTRVHELGGGESLIGVGALISRLRALPLAPENWWLIGLLLLPLAPAAVHAVFFLTRLWLRAIGASGLGPWLDQAIAQDGLFDRFVLNLVKRVLQLMPSGVALLLLMQVAPQFSPALQSLAAPAADVLFEACAQTARAIADWRL